jgi:hypothetical protein
VTVAEPLSDLRQRWAEEARERGEQDAAIDLEDLDQEDAGEELPVDPEAALRELRHLPDDDQPAWRRGP